MKAKEERVERSPNWQDHLSQLVNMSADITTPFGGRKTMRRQEMDSQNKRHTQSISSQEKMQGRSISSQEGMHGRGLAHDYRMHAETLAFRQEIEREKMALARAEHEAAMKAIAEGYGGIGSQGDEEDFRQAVEGSGKPSWFDLF